MPNTTTREYIMNSLEEYDEEATQFFDAHDYASHDAEGYEESGDPTYYNDDWSMTYDGTEYSLFDDQTWNRWNVRQVDVDSSPGKDRRDDGRSIHRVIRVIDYRTFRF